MSVKRTQIIDEREFTLEPLSDYVVEVEFREQMGWFGVNLGEDAEEYPFAWTMDPEDRDEDGLTNGFSVESPDQALQNLADKLASLQAQLESKRAKDPRNRLGAFLETLPDADDKEPSWRRFGRIGLDKVNKGIGALQEGTTRSGRIIRQEATRGKEAVQKRVEDMNLPEKRQRLSEVVNPSRECERLGHDLQEVKLVGNLDNVTRFCRRCRRAITPGAENGSGEYLPASEEYAPVDEEPPQTADSPQSGD